MKLFPLRIMTTLYGCLSLGMVFIFPADSYADTKSMSAYYPAPFGSYRSMRLYPRPEPPGSCPVGLFYADSVTSSLYLCRSRDGIVDWYPLPDVWDGSGDLVYLTNNSNPNLKIGIGTDTPPLKLSLFTSAGIVAKGTLASGQILPVLPVGPKFFWYPAKAALRAGNTNDQQWADAMIGDYSFGFGSYDQPATAQPAHSFIGGGKNNTVSNNFTIVGGGENNTAAGSHSAVFSGLQNSATGNFSAVLGGHQNSAQADYSFVGGGQANIVRSTHSSIFGGDGNLIEPSSPYSTIGGGYQNRIDNEACVPCAGLGCPLLGSIVCELGASLIGGGYQNTIKHNYSVIAGGDRNEITEQYATIFGGSKNRALGQCASILGGEENTASGEASTILGGSENTASGLASTIAGGQTNTAGGIASVVFGGKNNIVNGAYSAISGGSDNIIDADHSWIPVGKNMRLANTADNSFLWGYSDTPVEVTAPDTFILASGTIDANPWNPKVGFAVLAPAAVLEINANPLPAKTKIFAVTSTQAAVVGNIFVFNSSDQIGIGKAVPAAGRVLDLGPQANNAYLASNGAWQDTSSRREYKKNISDLQLSAALDTLHGLEPVRYVYKTAPGDEHLGFIAEDVPDLVAVKDRRSLSSVDILAVLSKVIKYQDETIARQEKTISDLENRIHKIKKRQK